jgi:deoxyribodipyrimidine photo-lyase
MFYDRIDNVILKLKNEFGIEAVFFNKDYTPFARKRDSQINLFCQKEKIECFSFHDALLLNPKNTKKDDGSPYTVFTPFYKKNMLNEIRISQENNYENYFGEKINFSLDKFPEEFDGCNNKNLNVNGGRVEAFEILSKKKDILAKYKDNRNFPDISGTTTLSAHLKFGCISPRELNEFLKENYGEENELSRQLFWRDFHYSVAYFFPYVFGGSFHKKYDRIIWENDIEKFERWKLGKTGYPIVDAAMRELNETGWMHNRVRMVVASFLVKDLHIDWRWGEKYFAQKLVDYDPCLNNGNWQWSASTGCDAQPYFRIFNPFSQQIRFDENCNYIKKWLPELKYENSKDLHKIAENYPKRLENNYPKVIVEHKTRAEIAKRMFANC